MKNCTWISLIVPRIADSFMHIPDRKKDELNDRHSVPLRFAHRCGKESQSHMSTTCSGQAMRLTDLMRVFIASIAASTHRFPRSVLLVSCYGRQMFLILQDKAGNSTQSIQIQSGCCRDQCLQSLRNDDLYRVDSSEQFERAAHLQPVLCRLAPGYENAACISFHLREKELDFAKALR